MSDPPRRKPRKSASAQQHPRTLSKIQPRPSRPYDDEIDLDEPVTGASPLRGRPLPKPVVRQKASSSSSGTTEATAAQTLATADEAKASTNRSHRRDTIITTGSGLAVYGLSVLTGPLLARALDTAGRGAYSAVNTPTQIIGWMLMFGLPLATAYHASNNDRRKLWAVSWAFVVFVGIPVVAALWFLVPLFLHQYPGNVVGWFRAYLVAGLLVLPYQSVYEYSRATGKNIKFNVYRSLPLVINTIAVVVLFVVGRLTLNTALAAMCGANIVLPLIVVALERGFVLPLRRNLDMSLGRELLNYGRRVAFGLLSTMVLARFDQFLMVGLVSPSQLGLYAVAVTAAGLTAPIAQGVGFTLFPYLRSEKDPQVSWRRMWQALRWVSISTIVMGGLMAVAAPWGLPKLMGDGFRDALPAFFLLLPGQICWNLGEVFKSKLEAENRPGLASNSLLAAAGFTVAVDPFVVPIWGIEGAAIVTSVSQLVYALLAWRFVHRNRPSRQRGAVVSPA